MEDDTTLKVSEIHPSAQTAFVWFHQTIVSDPMMYVMLREALKQTALKGNRLAQVCYGTMLRLDKNEPVSDRYLLGLCWFIRDFIEQKTAQEITKKEITKKVKDKSAKRKKGKK